MIATPIHPPAEPRARELRPFAISLVCLAWMGCGGPTLEGTVKDPWDHKLADVTVVVEGVAEQMSTDENGKFEVETEPGATLNLIAGAEGYIKTTSTVRIPRSDNADLPTPELVLYPDPEQPGFYAVDAEGYARLDEQPVRSVGTDLSSFTGVPDVGPHALPTQEQLRVVFATNLRRADIARLDLRLTRIGFVDKRPIKDVYGDNSVTVNLWVPEEDVAFDITGLASATDYLITSRAPLTPGAYAFHIQGVLTDPDVHHLERLPREMRVAYPFEVRGD